MTLAVQEAFLLVKGSSHPGHGRHPMLDPGKGVRLLNSPWSLLLPLLKMPLPAALDSERKNRQAG